LVPAGGVDVAVAAPAEFARSFLTGLALTALFGGRGPTAAILARPFQARSRSFRSRCGALGVFRGFAGAAGAGGCPLAEFGVAARVTRCVCAQGGGACGGGASAGVAARAVVVLAAGRRSPSCRAAVLLVRRWSAGGRWARRRVPLAVCRTCGWLSPPVARPWVPSSAGPGFSRRDHLFLGLRQRQAGAVCAVDAVLANCIFRSAGVVASSTRTKSLSCGWHLRKKPGNKALGFQRIR